MLVLLLIPFVVLLFTGMPVAFGMMLATTSYLAASGESLTVLAQKMGNAPDSFTLLGLPLFLLAGSLMNQSGMTERLVRFSRAVVGHFTGGLAHVTVVSNMIMAGMSGSATADAAGTGSILIPAMRRAGFGAGFSAALTAAAATIGPIIPPSIPMILYGGMADVSVGRLFLGGAVPGVIMGLYLMGAVYLVARRRGYAASPRATGRELYEATKGAVLALLMPVIILGGIFAGITTPTEAAGIAVVYAFVVGAFVYRALTWPSLRAVLLEAAVTTAVVMFLVAAAFPFAWVLTTARAGDALIAALHAVSSSPALILMLINLLVLFLGCFMEAGTILIVLTPILTPGLKALGVDPVHFGLVLVLACMIGLVTPPVGMAMYICCRIAGVSIPEFAREVGPFLVALLAVLVMITYMPDLVLFLPNLVLGKGR
ncbi:MAG: TRAP transporter large permease [Candidatus Rokubacteria bacterium]|nr:TRAP transporter large permease [Candidatus Rokubacteria bacterium]